VNATENIRKRLDLLDLAIARHPLSSRAVTSAFAVIEKHGKKNVEAISLELAQKQLPPLDELGRIQLRTSFSWWNLHRKRRSLLRKLARSD
jgi:hypothetical protein